MLGLEGSSGRTATEAGQRRNAPSPSPRETALLEVAAERKLDVAAEEKLDVVAEVSSAKIRDHDEMEEEEERAGRSRWRCCGVLQAFVSLLLAGRRWSAVCGQAWRRSWRFPPL
jgi:hypothetical protein